MATCYLCGSQIPQGQGIRRRVNTGVSVGGFNLSTNPVVAWILNSLLTKRAAAFRSYYSLRTVCSTCARTIDARERRITVAIILVSLLAVLMIVLFASRH
jgi:hypothetical protein